jgi:SOS-response transcriptional repressor LexA
MLEKIVSGGQTGVDRGALDAALDRGFPIGGWLPKGRKAEDGPVPDRYAPMMEAPRADYPWRTERNVLDSDATLVLAPDPARLSPGTRKTVALALKHRKPARVSPLAVPFRDLSGTVGWLETHNVRILNVAGPRESKHPGVQALTRAYVSRLLALAVGPALLPDVPESARFATHLPLYSLQAACGHFGHGEEVECLGWLPVETPGRFSPAHFVARAVGHSMEPRIPDGALCLFLADPGGTRQDGIVLAEHLDASDPDTGGGYSVKRYSSVKSFSPDGTWAHESITLSPLNPDYSPISIPPDRADSFRIVARFVRVL